MRNEIGKQQAERLNRIVILYPNPVNGGEMAGKNTLYNFNSDEDELPNHPQFHPLN